MKLASVVLTLLAVALPAHPAFAAGNFGAVNFQTSCSPAVVADFNHAVALLHSFEYDEARDAFSAVAAKDPTCAMAQWGTAMTYYHGLWGEIDVPKGRAASSEAARIASANPRTTARERAFIDSVAAVYADDQANWAARAETFSGKLKALHSRWPNDEEAAIFYALSLDESALPGPDYRKQRECVSILEPLFREHPDHPGIAHYLIHCSDNPAMAREGLAAAQAYAKVAPASAHATHMPSHIFVRLGMWNETIASNLASLQASESDPAESECERHDNELHAMHFLQFAYLQAGRMKEAKKVVDRALALPPTKDASCRVSAAAIAASYALDARDWQMAATLKDDAGAGARDRLLVLAATGIGSARSGDLARAENIERELQTSNPNRQLGSVGFGNREIVRLEIASEIAEARKDQTSARELMQAAVKAGTFASWIMPPPEQMLGDVLLEQQRPQEALAAYRAALSATPNLFNALLGAARAAEALGDHTTAEHYYRQLVDVAGQGDRPELESARKRLLAAGN